MWDHLPVISELKSQKQENRFQLEGSLVYRVSCSSSQGYIVRPRVRKSEREGEGRRKEIKFILLSLLTILLCF